MMNTRATGSVRWHPPSLSDKDLYTLLENDSFILLSKCSVTDHLEINEQKTKVYQGLTIRLPYIGYHELRTLLQKGKRCRRTNAGAPQMIQVPRVHIERLSKGQLLSLLPAKIRDLETGCLNLDVDNKPDHKGHKIIRVNRHKCNFCGHIANCFQNLEAHIRTHTREKPYSCRVCVKDFTRKHNKLLHEHRFHRHIFKCQYLKECKAVHHSICDLPKTKEVETGNFKTQKQKMRISRHIYAQKNVSSQAEKHLPQFFCSQCPKRFYLRKALQIHERHHRRYTGKAYSSIKIMQSRMNPKQGIKFRCHHCPMNFLALKDFKKHVQKHDPTSMRCDKEKSLFPFACSECPERFSAQYLLNQHNLFHTRELFRPILLICCTCGQSFSRPDDLALHQLIHGQEKMAICQYSKDGSTHRYLFSVRDEQTETSFSNDSTPSGMQVFDIPQKQIHLDTVVSNFQVPKQRVVSVKGAIVGDPRTIGSVSYTSNIHSGMVVQGSGVNTFESIKRPAFGSTNVSKIPQPEGRILSHKSAVVASPGNVYSCTSCPMKFFDQNFLNIHSAIHAEDRPYACSQCSDIFKYSSSLQLHQRIHKTIVFACLDCPREYGSEEALDNHQMSHERPVSWKCGFCTKAYFTPDEVKSHEFLEHENESAHVFAMTKPITLTVEESKKLFCQYCGKLYHYASAFAAHERLHTGERPFECAHCQMKFRGKRNLRKHVEKRHKQGLLANDATNIASIYDDNFILLPSSHNLKLDLEIEDTSEVFEITPQLNHAQNGEELIVGL